MPRPKRQVTVFAPALKALRAEQHLSQKQLAVLTNHQVSAAMIAFIELGKRQPSLPNAQALADALGVPLDHIALVERAA